MMAQEEVDTFPVDIRWQDHREPERCLVAEFFAKEQRKPLHLQSGVAWISCPCSKCNPAKW